MPGQPTNKRQRKDSEGAANDGTPDDESFACPFCVKFPGQYRACRSIPYKRIGDVRQHIKRKHRQPRHCPRCGVKYESDDELKTHLNLDILCRQKEFHHDGATEDQWQAIERAANDRGQHAQSSHGTTSEEKRWFKMWEILFDPEKAGPYPSCQYSCLDLHSSLAMVSAFRGSESFKSVLVRFTLEHQSLEDILGGFSAELFRVLRPFAEHYFSEGSTPENRPPENATTREPVITESMGTGFPIPGLDGQAEPAQIHRPQQPGVGDHQPPAAVQIFIPPSPDPLGAEEPLYDAGVDSADVGAFPELIYDPDRGLDEIIDGFYEEEAAELDDIQNTDP